MKKIFISFLFVLLFSQIIIASGFLRAEDKKIVNDEGEILLRGIGLGGWLLQEGYMLKTSGFANAEHEIKKHIQEVLGDELTEQFYDYYHDNFVVKEDIDQIAEWGFNSIRLPFSYKRLTPPDQPGVYLEEGFQRIDKLLEWCEANELYLILDMHACPGGQSDEPISDYNSDELSLWESEENKQRTIDLWVKLAERYKDEKWIGGYDLINEPKWDLGPNNAPLRELYIDITNAIREVDSNHIIFIEGNWFATDFNGLTPPWDDNMVYSFHKYWNENTTTSIQNYLSLRENHNVPLWHGESGENSNVWFRDCIKLYEDNNIGWAWWPLKKIESIAGPLSADMTPGYQKLLNYWKGSGSKPTAQQGFQYLTEQVDELKLENCTFRPGVIDAMFRQITDDSIVPLKDNEIPGRIFCADYDLGLFNQAYFDKDYQNINGPGGDAYNLGHQYRNDGVDIEECSDDITNGYNVGWIDSGEFLKFTVNFKEEGKYKIVFRVSGSNSGGKVQLYLDGAALTGQIDVPVTGGWQNWETLNLGDYNLPGGEHTLMVRFFFGGFNANYLEFSKTTTDVDESTGSKLDFKLEQNYPNPFNGFTTINYTIPERTFVELNIFDTTGQKLERLVQKEQNKGNYRISWNSQGISSGVYYYKLTAGDYSETRKLVLLK